MKKPLVSIVVPTHNRARFIGGAIESVLAQTFQDWETIIVNDGGTDDTDAVVQPYCAQDPRIRYIKQANTGLSGARNKALSEAQGRYVALLDDDDRWAPEKLEIQVAYLEDHPEAGMCYARQTAGKSPKTFPELLQPFQSIMPSTVMMRREHLAAIGGFSVKLRLQEDYDCWLRFAQRWPLAPIDRTLMHVAKGERATLSGDLKRNHIKAIEVLKALELTPENRRYHGMRMHYIGYIHYLLAREYYAEGRFWLASRRFIAALRHDPAIGLRFKTPQERGLQLVLRLAKSYAAVPICLAKGVLHAVR